MIEVDDFNDAAKRTDMQCKGNNDGIRDLSYQCPSLGEVRRANGEPVGEGVGTHMTCMIKEESIKKSR